MESKEPINGNFKLPKLISNGMVLQRNTTVKIWGWADRSEIIKINFMDKSYNCKTGNDEKWLIKISTGEAGGPYEMKIDYREDEIVIADILIGDVWVCSGQSNMGINMSRVSELYASDIEKSFNPSIRHFLVPDNYNFNHPCEDVISGSWKTANPDNVLQFSAVAYYFAKTLFERYKIPVGLITAGIGGSSIESWMSESALIKFPAHMDIARIYKNQDYLNHVIKNNQDINDKWYDNIDKNDAGMSKYKISWYETEYEDSDWNTITIPSSFKDAGLREINGVVWFRKEITIPKSMTGLKGKIYLGRIIDSDRVYINGTIVGSISYQYPPRIYEIPFNLLKQGKNIISIRVIANNGNGGFIKDKPYKLTVNGESADLKGEWKYKIGYLCNPLPDTIMITCQPLGLYNGMIAPLINYSIKGVLWYQGESNIKRATGYKEALTELVYDWRKKWDQGDFPFLYVQLPNYLETQYAGNWALLRHEQLKSLDINNTGMAVSIDLGEWNDLHPLRKKDAGFRLALLAQKIAYNDDNIVYSGPIYKSMEIKNNKIIISFTSTGSGLMIKNGDKLNHFTIAGNDGEYIPAEAEISDNKVVVWNVIIKNPVSVRYAWSDNPENINFYNKEELPASPFTTE